MRKLYIIFILLFTAGILLIPDAVKASHVMGADMTWKCKGKDTFVVTVTGYRDCNGIDLSPAPIEVTSKCGTFSTNASTTQSGGLDITPRCKKTCTRCTDRSCKFQFGIQQYQQTATIVLTGSNCCDFTLGWQQCCRNAAITTGAAGNNFYCESKLNRCTVPCDNSPYFTNPPVAIFCKGQCVIINPGANDDDKNGKGEADSLSYAFTDPLSGSGSTIPYTSGYSFDQPLKYTGTQFQDFNPPGCYGFHLDSTTGDISFKASKEDQTVIALSITEWRKDSTGKAVAIGTIRRDLQVAIIECPDNKAPFVTTENNQKKFDFCAGRTKCIKFNSFDLDQDDSVTLIWNNQLGPLGGVFKVADPTKKWPQASFCWTPTQAMVRSLPYQFVVTAIDNACPVPGRTSKTIQIVVNPSPTVNYAAVLDSCGWVKFNAVRNGKEPGGYTYLWSGDGAKRANGTQDRLFAFGSSFKYKYTAGGTYRYSLTVTNTQTLCTTVYTDSIIIKNYIGVDLPRDTTVCKGSTISITASGHGGKGSRKYYWSTGPQDPSINSITAKITKDTVFVVTIVDATLCSNYDSMKVFAHNLPRPNLGKDVRSCKGDTITLDPKLSFMKTIGWAKVNGSGGAQFLQYSDKYPVLDSGDYLVNVVDTIGCGGSDTIKVRFNPLVKVNKRDIDACRFDALVMDAGIGGASTTWTWYDLTKSTTKPVYQGKVYTVNPVLGDKFYQIVASQTLNGVTCKSVDTISVYSHPRPKVSTSKIPAQCYGSSPLDLTPYGSTPPAGGKGVWYFRPKKLAVINNMLYIDQLTFGTNNLVYKMYDRYGCNDSATATIQIDSLPRVYAGKDTILCSAGDTMYLRGLPTGGKWTAAIGVHYTAKNVPYFAPGDALSPDPIELVYSYISPVGAKCSSSDTMLVRVLPTPSTRAGSYGPYCKDTSTKIKPYLTNGLPQNGFWTSDPKQNLPAGALGFDNAANAFYFDPVKADSGLWRLVYTATADGKHCAVSDTTAVKVLPQPRFQLTTDRAPKTSFCVTDDPVKIIPIPSGNVSLIIDNNKTGGKGLIGSFFDPQTAGPGIHKIRATYTSPSGCKNAAEIFLRVDPQASASIFGANGFCEAPTYTIKGDSLNATWVKWTSADGQIVSPSFILTDFKPDTAAIIKNGGRFKVNLQAGNNGACKDTAVSKDFIIYYNPKVAFASTNQNGCAPFSTQFTSTSTVKRSAIAYYVWDFGDGTKDSTELDQVKHTYNNPGTYSVSLRAVSLKGGCAASLTKNKYITVNPVPIVMFGALPTYTTIALPKIQFNSYDDKGNPLSLGVDDATTYLWNFGDSKATATDNSSSERNPIHIYADTGKYTVKLHAKNKFGCEGDTTKINYIDIRPEIIVFIPNVFKPNGHSKSKANEKFSVVISSNATFDMSVFNRWGELMYHTNDVKEGWDGNYRNAACEEGVYVYVVKAQSFAGKEYTYTGTITLLR